MALKRSSPLDDPPSASSSEGEEEEVESEEDTEEEITDPKSSMKNLTTKLPRVPSPDPLRQTSSEEEKSDSDSGSDSDPSPPKSKSSHPSHGVEPNVKPITSKPKNENPNHKRHTNNASKRPIEKDKAEKAPMRKKKKVSDAEEEDEHLDEIEKKSGEDSKKLIQRLWSDEDEIVILKGMVSYVEKGLNPTANMNEFLDFIKKSLRADVNRIQLISKIQRLKQKFHNNVKRAKKDDEFPIFSKAHELKSYYLSNKIWGEKNGKVEETERSNVGGDSVNNGLASSQPESITLLEIPLEMKPEAEKEKIWNRYPYLKESLQLTENLITPPPGLGEDFMREGLGLIGASKAKELEQRWKILQIEELKTYLERVTLHHEQAELILNELKA